MAVLTWDEVGERFYRNGIDRGVLFLQDGRFAVWNGLTGIEESPNSELKSYFLDGVKYLETLIPSDFVGKLKAFTYPDEFEEVSGVAIVAPGFQVHDQSAKSFNLCYRINVGNDVEGEDFGYQIHILYNIIAKPDTIAYATQAESITPTEFSWSLSGLPEKIANLKPTSHISLDSRTTPPDVLALIEATLYGTETNDPTLPSITEIGEYYGYRGALLIVDFGDGSWMAIDESDTYITMNSPTQFTIDGAEAVYLDEDTYTISSSNVGEEE